mmetsp:Transcript_19417/g.38952  ORF Transcript_19417/g.38952 Transcript_19417/m.38952 type:complete len:625 (-) Transcript_19417:164-2038(-)|eukprot:CAMPEP_0113381302 /NCGR_PEP_ID=MMETSP0013_2-20120614/5222_1 /TAXON_ID=2843 ORGANISM="Skeletonema costatum, Strain 1716" /NCGR_SAMPLE_ID=MMETSP0013_2 /ASSEMBLY_ACC=CAM_ASM_000158 /LENGTH=624 /DNA_ID=CAMNT_0000263705 /DNA_START=113 /DNA_END=1987 /DNA_ORIENTATION=+ /assembly_acc=CAM_ASM_000158
MDSSTLCLSNLRRHTISIILAYLQQQTPSASKQTTTTNTPIQPHNRDALSLLITTKRFAYAILPLFRVPRHVCQHYQHKLEDGSCIIIVEKYRFVVLPIQDPVTLLDRLNTKRLRQRILWVAKNSANKKTDTEDVTQNSSTSACYHYGRSTDELAFEEWSMMQIHQDVKQNNEIEWKTWPAHLELLRFLDDQYGHMIESSSNLKQRTNQSKRTVQLPSCLLPNMSKANATNTSSGNAFRPGIVLLASYPRSGNTLLRTLLERTTSIVTGSDTRPDRTLSKSLAMQYDLVGEGLVGKATDAGMNKQKKQSSSARLQIRFQTAYDPSLSIVKTHFPERKGWKPVNSSRVLLLIRNPYDSIDSYWNLCCTNTHTTSLDESVYKKYANKFESLARHEIQIWVDFHYYWLDLCEKEGVPLLVVRYEDLVLDPESEMQRVIAFLMEDGDDKSLFDSFWKWRIRHALGKSDNPESQSTTGNTSNLGSYQPRSSSGGILSIGKTLRKDRYSESTLTHMHDVAATVEANRNKNTSKFASIPSINKTKKNQSYETILQKFGYDIYNQNFPENFKHPPPVPTFAGKQSKTPGRVTINKSPEIRSIDDEFGRKMTHWRRGETDNDANPFPTVARRR